MPVFAFHLIHSCLVICLIFECVMLMLQVFGADKRYWFIPTYSDDDLRRMPALQGLEYPSKPDFDSQEF